MAKYRENLPMLRKDGIFLGEGGLMTEFLFGEETKDIQLPGGLFFHLIKDEKVMNWHDRFYRQFMDLCLRENNGYGYIILAFFTYKARKEDAETFLNIKEEEWIKMNKDYIQRFDDIRTEYEQSIPNCPPILIQGLMCAKGDEGDAFLLNAKMTAEEAEEYHNDQIKMFAENTKVDFVFVCLVAYSEEAIGICNAAAKVNLPVVISFTTEMDGRLAGGESIKVLPEKIFISCLISTTKKCNAYAPNF